MGVDAREQGFSWGLIPLCVPSPLPHDLCHGQSSSCWLPAPMDHNRTVKSYLMINTQKTKMMEFGPITSGQIDGETMERAKGFIFLGSKITSYGNCSHEIKRCLLLGRKAMTTLDSILKSRYIIVSTNFYIAKIMVFFFRIKFVPFSCLIPCS